MAADYLPGEALNSARTQGRMQLKFEVEKLEKGVGKGKKIGKRKGKGEVSKRKVR